MARIFAVASCLLLLLLAEPLWGPPSAFAQERDRAAEALGSWGGEPFELLADQVSYEQERDLFEASGNVRLEQANGRTLSADWLLFNATTRVGVASGHVVMQDGTSTVRAEFATVDLETLIALAIHGEFDSPDPGFTVRADTLEKTGPNTLRVEDGVFTTCRCEGDDCSEDPWDVTAREADVRLGGYAVARDVRFRVRGTPVFYTPVLVFPVKTERQTGFLAPELAISGTNGLELTTPFFWAASPGVNVTLRPTWMEERGAKLSADVEYLVGERGEGRAFVSGLPDDKNVSSNDVDTPFSEHRWAYMLRHHQPLALEGARLALDLKGVSDNSYVIDFDDFERGSRQASFLVSRGWLAYGRGATYADVGGSYFDDLQNPEDVDRDDRLLQQLPDVNLSLLPLRLGNTPLLASFDGRYTYFYQRDSSNTESDLGATRGLFFDTGLDGLFNPEEQNAAGISTAGDENGDDFVLGFGGTEGDGFFQEGELLGDHGHRVDLYPRLSVVRRLGALETLSEVGLRETLYDAANGGAATRSIWTGRAEVQSHLFRDVTLFGRRLRHVMAPGVGFAYVSSPSQGTNPLFIPQTSVRARRLADGDLRTLLRAPTDRAEDVRFLRAGVDNRFFESAREPGEPARLVGQFRVSADYDLLAGRAGDVFVHSRYRPLDRLDLNGVVGYDLKKRRLNEADIGVSWESREDRRLSLGSPERRNSFSITYRFLRDRVERFEDFDFNSDFEDFDDDVDRINQLNVSGTLVVSPRFDIEFAGWGSLEGQSSGGRIGGVLHSSCACWDLVGSFEKRLRPDDTRFMFQVRLTGLGLGGDD